MRKQAGFPRLILALLMTFMLGAAKESRPEAKLEITGSGYFGNRALKKTIRLLESTEKKPEFFSANFVEDAAVIILSRLKTDGYLKPKVNVDLLLEDGSVIHQEWTDYIAEPLPRPLKIVKATYTVEEGILFYYDFIRFTGLETLTPKKAASYFYPSGGLVKTKHNRSFTPAKLKRSVGNLSEILARDGYGEATVNVDQIATNADTGGITVDIQVKQGRRFMVKSVDARLVDGTNENTVPFGMFVTNAPYSRFWLQDFEQTLRATNYHLGYPDTKIAVTTLNRIYTSNQVQLEMEADIQRGPLIHLAKVRFEGEKKTQIGMLQRRVQLKEGELLDRSAVENGRLRLSRLGVFKAVDLRYDLVDEETRDVTYALKEGKDLEMSLLFGYGSYETVRVGLELEQYNVFGRGHHSRLKLVQSLKSSSADYTYTLPELVGSDLDVLLDANALRRQEPTFERTELGVGAGVRKFLKPINSDVGLRYNYQILDASGRDVDPLFGRTNAHVGAFVFDFKHDRRDNALLPHSGYKLFTTLEVASEYLAGNANYQRFEFAGSFHSPLDEGRWIHIGAVHGVVNAMGNPASDLPFNKRFFPGGENSIRGFQEGQAAPRNAFGQIVGAETYSLASLEFEQALTDSISFVLFNDDLAFAREIARYPFDQTLFTVGVGLRWKTVLGPVRFEYGYNLNPRKEDPVGTFHFSIGFPF